MHAIGRFLLIVLPHVGTGAIVGHCLNPDVRNISVQRVQSSWKGGKVIDPSIQEYLESGFESMYSGKWKSISPGASIIETDEVGILVTHDREDQHLAFAVGVLSSVTLSPDLVRAVGNLNSAPGI
jgi:hypothetical protein